MLNATEVIYKKWECPSARAVFLLVHGLGGSAGRWGFLADFFLQNQIASYAIELKGFGATPGLKGHIDSFDIYHQDLRFLWKIIKNEHPGKKIFLMGESMGGLIAFLSAGFAPDLFGGVVCISPAFKSRLKFSLLDYIKIGFFMIAAPRRQMRMPFDLSMCTRDEAYQKAMETDAREHRLATPKFLWNILLEQRRAKRLEIKIPALFLVAGDLDRMTDPEAAKKIFSVLKTDDKEIIEYPEMEHALSIDRGREKVFADILQWVNGRI